MFSVFYVCHSPRYNCTGWLGVKHQFTYFLGVCWLSALSKACICPFLLQIWSNLSVYVTLGEPLRLFSAVMCVSEKDANCCGMKILHDQPVIPYTDATQVIWKASGHCSLRPLMLLSDYESRVRPSSLRFSEWSWCALLCALGLVCFCLLWAVSVFFSGVLLSRCYQVHHWLWSQVWNREKVSVFWLWGKKRKES